MKRIQVVIEMRSGEVIVRYMHDMITVLTENPLLSLLSHSSGEKCLTPLCHWRELHD